MDIEKIQESYAKLEQTKASEADKATRDKSHIDQLTGNDRVQKAVLNAAIANIKHRDKHEPKVEIKNFPKDLAQVKDVKELGESIDELGLTNYLNHLESVESVTDAIFTLVAHLNALPDKLKNDGFEMLGKKLDALPKPKEDIKVNNLKDIKPYFEDMIKAIKSLKVDPQVNVDVKPDPTDLTPILDVLNKEEKKEIEIEDFMVEDQEDEGTMQYFGLVHPTGAWMIIQNEVEKGSYGYAFGSDGYNFKARSNLEYGSVTGINAIQS